jgi:hypothetical protein
MSKTQPWKDAVAEQDVAPTSASGDNPEDMFRCTGFKVMKLEKLVLDSQKNLEANPEAAERASLEELLDRVQKELDALKGDLFRCDGSKSQKLEKLVLDTKKERDAAPEADHEALDSLISDAQKELDGGDAK